LQNNMATKRKAEPLQRSLSERAKRPVSYYNASDYGPLDLEHGESVEYHLERLNDAADKQGFGSVLAAALATVKSSGSKSRTDTLQFIKSGGMAAMLRTCLEEHGSNRYPILNNPGIRDVVCSAAESAYLKEWNQIIEEPAFKKPMTKFSPEYIDTFSFADIYTQMDSIAPTLMRLFNRLTHRPAKSAKQNGTSDPGGPAIECTSTGGAEPADPAATSAVKQNRSKQRATVVALSILGNFRNQQFNVVQGVVGYFLYSSRVPKRAIGIMDRLGISCGYSSIRDALRSNREAIKEQLKLAAGASGKAFQACYDNLTRAAHVKSERIINRTGFIEAVGGFFHKPHADLSHDMFTPEDCNYSRVSDLKAADLLPSEEDQRNLQSAFECMIAQALTQHAKEKGRPPPNLGFAMPSVIPLDRSKRPEIITLPMYLKNEAKLDDVVDLHHLMQNDLGLTDEQRTKRILMFAGDLKTSQMNRSTPLPPLAYVADARDFGSAYVRRTADWITSTRLAAGSICR
jgi:hypothetical protein